MDYKWRTSGDYLWANGQVCRDCREPIDDLEAVGKMRQGMLQMSKCRYCYNQFYTLKEYEQYLQAPVAL